MYTTYGTGFGKFSQTYHIGTRKYGHKPGHQEQKEKKTPSRRKPHGFLNTKIPSIAPWMWSCHTILQAGLPQEKKYVCYIMHWIP